MRRADAKTLGAERSVWTGAALALLAAPAFAQPSNDECVGALPILSAIGSATSTVGATTSAPAWPCGAGANDVWYAWVPGAYGNANVTTCVFGATNFDTVLAAYDGSCGALNLLACDDNSCGIQSQVSFPVAANTTYYVRVGGAGGAVGNFALSVLAVAWNVPGDECSSATPLVEGVTSIYTNAAATTSSPPWPCAAAGNDVWYAFTPTCTHPTSFTLCTPGFANFDAVLAVYDGTCAAPNLLACNDDFCALDPFVNVPTTAGTTYYFRVGSKSGATGTFAVSVDHGGFFTTQPAGCGPVTLTAAGPPELGRTSTFVLGGGPATAVRAIWVGSPTAVVLCPSSCVLGATPDAIFVGSPFLTATIPCLPGLVGATISVQGAVLGVFGACPAPIPFELSPTVHATIG